MNETRATRLILVRHGERAHLPGGPIARRVGCGGLTVLGEQQVQRLAERFARSGEANPCAALLTSPVLRARQTAQILAPALNVQKIEEEDGLGEIDPGEADGLTPEEYTTRYGSFAPSLEPDRPFAPGGESWRQYLVRVNAVLGRLAEHYSGQTVVCATHGGFIVVSLLTLFNIGEGSRAWLDPAYASLTEWKATEKAWILMRYNDTAHLTPG